MKPDNPNSAFSAGAGTARALDSMHLLELLRSLRALAADSPERQARIERLALDYASGAYNGDAQATAAKLIDDALFKPPSAKPKSTRQT